MKREYRLRDMIKEGILDIFYIWKAEFNLQMQQNSD